MKIPSTLLALMLAATAAQAQSNYVYNFTENTAIPAGNPSGVFFSTNLSGMSEGGVMSISNVTVNLNISGGFNGNLYAYLSGPDGAFAVLLNRVGMSSSNSFGYANAGMNVTFNDMANSGNIHNYQNDSPGYNGSGQLLGTWAADGQNIDPNSPPSAFDGAPDTAGLLSYNGDDPDGTWTLFLADLSSGPQSTIVSWSLDITTVPEPAPLSLLMLGGLGALLVLRWRK